MDINITLSSNKDNSDEATVRAYRPQLNQRLLEKYPSANVSISISHHVIGDVVKVSNCSTTWQNTLIEREVATNHIHQVWDESISKNTKNTNSAVGEQTQVA